MTLTHCAPIGASCSMLRSLSFRQQTQSLGKTALKELQRKIVERPEPQDVLLWLKSVRPDRVLLVVPEDTSIGKPSYVKGEKPEWILMISQEPTRSMVALQDLFKRMLPAKADVAPEVWRAAKPLKKLLASDEVQKQGVRRTAALIAALEVLSKARQAQLDSQGVRLGPAPTEKDEEAVSVVKLEPVASTGRMVRRGKSLNLSRARMDPDPRSKGLGGD